MNPVELREDEAFVLRADGQVEPCAGPISLKEAQRAVGGYVEAVTIPEGAQVLVNEEGKLLGLPRNASATELVQNAGLHPDDHICGAVVVLTGKRRWL